MSTAALKNHLFRFVHYCFFFAFLSAMRVTQAATLAPTNTPCAIPWNEVGARRGADYQGDGLAVTPTESGAHLHCVFQRLDGEATPDGLWLTSTVTNTISDRFRVTAVAVGRKAANAIFDTPYPESSIPLPGAGEVTVCGQTVRFSRPGLTEEYSVSMGGVRQDFVVMERPAGAGELQVRLEVAGARVGAAAGGAQLVLARSGRKIAYSRLRVTDAKGKEFPARIEARGERSRPGATVNASLTDRTIEPEVFDVVVNDMEAIYPVRIDPTFSDSQWISLGGFLGTEGGVYAAVVDGSGNLYVGGNFRAAGDVFATNIAEWNGSSWSALGSGLGGISSSQVFALAVSGSDLYAGGYFTTAGGSYAVGIAEWDGSNWSALGSGMNGSVNALAVSGSNVYAGGEFTTAGGATANYIAQWNGSSWSPLGSGMSTYVNALAVSGNVLYAGGYFTTAGGSVVNSIAQWNGSSWSALGSGIEEGSVNALAVSGSNLYAGGVFTKAGGISAYSIAQWNGSSWSALGSGSEVDEVFALAVSGNVLYAGGEFTTPGSAGNFIAQWNGSIWSPLGSGMGGNDSSVSALAVSGSDLYAAGDFTTAGGGAVESIAQWNGSSWSALGSGMNGSVLALAVSGSNLYAGGIFTKAGGSSANYIAQWNGSSWAPLGSGMSSEVYALAVSGSNLYVGGYFTTAGGGSAEYIAQWNGSTWSALGSGMNGSVNALALSGSTLYAAGYFTTAGGSAANYIAQWNGSSWSALGSGMNSHVYALAVSDSTLYAGGDFTTAGGEISTYAAMANLAGTPASVAIITNNAAIGFTDGLYGFDVSGPSGSNVVIQASTDLQTWIPLQTNLLGSGFIYFSDPQLPTNRQRFYRAVLP